VSTVAGGQWPGQRVVEQRGDDACRLAVQRYVGVDRTASDLNYSKYSPNERSWLAGRRGVVCVVGEMTGKTTGRLRGAHR
jgi:hypothetical protein